MKTRREMLQEGDTKQKRSSTEQVLPPDLFRSILLTIERYGFAELDYKLVGQLLPKEPPVTRREPPGTFEPQPLTWKPDKVDEFAATHGLSWAATGEQTEEGWPSMIRFIARRT